MARGTKHVTKTTKIFRDMGYSVGIVERRVPTLNSSKAVDLFGFADLLAFDGGNTVLIQVCGEDFAPHVKKMLGAIQEGETAEDAQRRVDYAKRWLTDPNRKIELWGWRKLKNKLKAGGFGKGHHWEPRIKEFTLEDYNGLD